MMKRKKRGGRRYSSEDTPRRGCRAGLGDKGYLTFRRFLVSSLVQAEGCRPK